MAIKIRAKAPARISFAGGGTDVEPYMSRYGGCVVSATINKYSYVTITENMTDCINLHSIDMDSFVQYTVDTNPLFDGKLDLAKISITKMMGVTRTTGIDVTTMSEVPPGSGLGTSSTMMVAIICAMQGFIGANFNKYELAHLAYKFEREELGLEGGHQDQYAATFGGFNFIEFSTDGVQVTPLRLSKETINELEMNLMLCYTGNNHISANIIRDQQANVRNGAKDAIEAMHMQAELARDLRNLLVRNQTEEFGRQLNVAWQYKKKMASSITDSNIDRLYEVALRHGALGGKLLGAGGGGYLLLFVPPERQSIVRDALVPYGAQFMPFNFEFDGCQFWNIGTSEVYSRLVAAGRR